MSETNPFTPSQEVQLEDGIERVKVRPIELLKQSYEMISNQYWLFFGICVVGILIASAVPMGLIMGPMMIGIYLSFLHLEAGQNVEFGTLFKGFDQFADALIATLIIIAISFVAVIPAMLVLFLVCILPVIAMQGSDGDPPGAMLGIGVLAFYAGIILVSVAVTLPFLFTFQLMAERKLKAMDSIKLSARAVWRNLGGIFKFFFVQFAISLFLAMLCYFPVFFFLPISFGAMFLLYRQIFPRSATLEVHGEQINEPVGQV